MVIKFIETARTKFRVRKETASSFAHPSKGKPVKAEATPTSGEHGGSFAFLMATDPPNTVEHYDDLIFAMLQKFQTATILVFELPGFALSVSSSATAVQTIEDLAEFVQSAVRIEGLSEHKVGLFMPCASGLLVPGVMERINSGVVDFVSVPQCGNYACESHWADGINVGGMLSMSMVSRAFNYLRKKSIAKGWYRSILPARGSYDEIAPGLQVREASTYVRQRFTDIAYKNFDQGGQFPLAFFLQILFFSPLVTDAEVLEQLQSGTGLIQVPTLAVWGMQDGSHRRSLKDEELITSFGQYVEPSLFRVEKIQESAHFPDLQSPYTFVERLTNFLESFDLHTPGQDGSRL